MVRGSGWHAPGRAYIVASKEHEKLTFSAPTWFRPGWFGRMKLHLPSIGTLSAWPLAALAGVTSNHSYIVDPLARPNPAVSISQLL